MVKINLRLESYVCEFSWLISGEGNLVTSDLESLQVCEQTGDPSSNGSRQKSKIFQSLLTVPI